MNYTIKYKRRFFWKTIKNCISHNYTKPKDGQDKLWVLTDKGGFEINEWSKCSIKLGEDWVKYIEHCEKVRLEFEAKGKK